MRYITLISTQFQTIESVLIRRLHLVGKNPYTVKHKNIDRITRSLEAMTGFIKTGEEYPNGKDGKLIVYTGYFAYRGGDPIPKGRVTVTLYKNLHIEVEIS